MNKQGLQFTIGVILLTATTALAAVCNKLVQSVDDCDTLRCGTSSPSLENDCQLKILDIRGFSWLSSRQGWKSL